jgi:ribosomal protein L27
VRSARPQRDRQAARFGPQVVGGVGAGDGARVLRRGGQVVAARDVARGEDVRHGRPAAIVYRDRSGLRQSGPVEA